MIELLSIQQAARRYGIQDDFLYAAIKRGELPAIRVRGGSRWKVTEEIMDNWILTCWEVAK